MATFSSPVIVIGDFNIHVDTATDLTAIKLDSLLNTYGYTQYVKQPTHRDGHVPDLILTNSEIHVDMLPLLSDHSFVVAELRNPPPPPLDAGHIVRQWRNFDIDPFTSDLTTSDLTRSPPDDLHAAFEHYDITLRRLIDKHAPCVTKRCRRRQSARWFDAKCLAAKRTTRYVLQVAVAVVVAVALPPTEQHGVNSLSISVVSTRLSLWSSGLLLLKTVVHVHVHFGAR